MYPTTLRSFSFLVLYVHIAAVLARPLHFSIWTPRPQPPLKTRSIEDTVASFPEMNVLFEGNRFFRDQINTSQKPQLLASLTENGQSPDFLFIGCSDSRVSEGTIFSAEPGTMFTERNIANQYSSADPNAATVLSYAVAELGVRHVIVMGHYGCGGVGASIASAPRGKMDAASGVIQSWIAPIRRIYETSERPEIVELRQANANRTEIEEPKPAEPGFRALVEENVKHSVEMITRDPSMQNHWEKYIAQEGDKGNPTEGKPERRAQEEGAPLKPVFVHGFVYDIENGEVKDLGISRGPPGVEVKSPPPEKVKRHAESVGHDHDH